MMGFVFDMFKKVRAEDESARKIYNLNEPCTISDTGKKILFTYDVRLTLCTVVFAVIFMLCLLTYASSQTLDQQIVRLLSDNCAQLTGGGSDPLLGDNLNLVCRRTGPSSTPAGASSGGGAASSQASGTLLTQKRVNELREGEEDKETEDIFNFEGFSVWASGDVEDLDRDVTTFEDGYDSFIWGTSLGTDYVFTESFFAGIAFNYQNQDGNFTGGGDFNTDSYGGVLYGSYFPFPGFFTDVVLGYARKNYDVDRAVFFQEIGDFNQILIGTASSDDNNGDEYSAGCSLGYDYPINNVTVGARAGMNYINTEIDKYREKGGTGLELIYDDRERTSLQSVVSIESTVALSTGIGVFSPYVNFEWVHEFDDDQKSIDVQFAEDLRSNPTYFSFHNEAPDRNFYNLRTGVSTVLPHDVQLFAEFKALLNHDYFSGYGGSAGVRVAF